jgi:long-chain acyl-CoA synthetase
VVFAQDARVVNELRGVQGSIPSLERIIGLDAPEAESDSYAALLTKGRTAPVDPIFPAASDVAGYIYTSGTTGTPKGVILSHRNICSNTAAIHEVFPLHAERSLAFLPWAHSFGQTAELHFFVHDGHSMAINDDPTHLVSNLAEVKPTILLAVPRIFNRIYDGVHRQMAAKPKAIRMLFKHGLELAGRRNRGESISLTQTITLALAEKLIFSKVRAKFGGRLKLVISGSAALNKDVAEFVDALGIMVYEGYGLTETSPVATTNYPGNRKIGSVGKALPGCRVSIDESRSDNRGEGEIVLYGPNIMQGYHNQPEETAAVLLPDGGFRSGDLGRVDADGYLYITGRIKEQYKLENGKYVAPAMLEEELKLSPYISNVMLYGANRPFNVALVVADKTSLETWAKEQGVQLSITEGAGIAQNPRVHELLMAELERFGNKFKNYERPKKIAVVLDDFTTDNGLLTPSLKIRRNHVLKKYEREIEALYY